MQPCQKDYMFIEAAGIQKFHDAAWRGDIMSLELWHRIGVRAGCRLSAQSDTPLLIVVDQLVNDYMAEATSNRIGMAASRKNDYRRCFEFLLYTCSAGVHDVNESGESPLTCAIKAGQGALAVEMVNVNGVRGSGRRLRNDVRVMAFGALRTTFQKIVGGPYDELKTVKFCRWLFFDPEGRIPNLSPSRPVVRYCCRPEVPMCTAARLNMLDVVEALLKFAEHRDDINERDEIGRTALHYVVENYAKYDRADDDEETEASRKRHEQVIDSLCRAGASLDVLSYRGESALSVAVRLGLHALVERLVKVHGANPNFGLAHKFPMCYACASGDASMVKLLLDVGAGPDVGNGAPLAFGWFDAKFSRQLFDRLQLMEEYWSSQPLGIAVRNLDVPTVALLLARGANPNRLDDDGMAPLHRLAWVATRILDRQSQFVFDDDTTRKCAEIVELLLDRGADVNLPSRTGVTPIGHMARAVGVVSRWLAPGAIKMAPWRRAIQLMICHLIDNGAKTQNEQLDITVRPADVMVYVDDDTSDFLHDLFRAGVGWHQLATFAKGFSDIALTPTLCVKLLRAFVLCHQKTTDQDLEDLRKVRYADKVAADLDQFLRWAKEIRVQPPSLLSLCRGAIRRRLIEANPTKSLVVVFMNFPLCDDFWFYLQYPEIE